MTVEAWVRWVNHSVTVDGGQLATVRLYCKRLRVYIYVGPKTITHEDFAEQLPTLPSISHLDKKSLMKLRSPIIFVINTFKFPMNTYECYPTVLRSGYLSLA